MMNDARHRRDRCMVCAKPPEFEILWAEGMAHAWFCEKHLKEFVKKSFDECLKAGEGDNCASDIISIKKIGDDIATKKFAENKNPNILTEFIREARISLGLTSQDAEELAPVNPSGNEIGEEITLDEILPFFKSFYRTKPYVSLIGGLCTQGKTKGDIDIFIRSAHRDMATEFRIIRMFPEKYWFRFQFHYPEETNPGVYTDFVDIYDKKIEIISTPRLVLMSIPKKVELFKFAKLLKPAHGHFKGEEYSIGKLIEVVNAKPEWYEKGTYVQKKFDGVHVRADHSKEGKVIVWTEEGSVITEKLPTIVKAIKKACSGHDIAFVGELEFWKDKKHQSRQQTTAIIHTKDIHPDEDKIILNFFDVLFYDKDVHNETYSERLKFADELRASPQLRKAEYSLVRTPTELRREVEHYASQPGSEGAYLKRRDFKYELDGKTLLNLKYKNTFSWDVAVRRIDKIKNANAWSYLCIIEGEKGEAVPCGKTYNTSIGRTKTEPLRENDILKVEFVNLNKYVDPETKRVWYNMWSPHPLLWRQDKKRADDVRTAEKLVDASKGTVSEKQFPKRYLDGRVENLPMYPDESKKWKGMCHSHIRGKSVHLDFRLQVSKDYLVGWTLYIPKGLSKAPEAFAEAKALNEKEIMPIVRKKLSDPLLKFNCRRKAPEPIEWASYEGTVQPGSVGATKMEHGHFIIIDSFDVEYGAQKPHFHEYFCDGKLFDGRMVFTLLENKKEWKKTDEGLMTWMASIAKKSPTPYVLNNRAKQKKWIPPYTFSALPAKIRKEVPRDLRYWEHKNLHERLELRNELVRQVKKQLLKLDAIGPARFRFIKQTWEEQKVVRKGASRTAYYFIIFQRSEGKEVFGLAMMEDITKKEIATGLEVTKLYEALKVVAEGDVPPKSVLNPTTATPSEIEVLDEGSASILSVTGFRRYKLKGKEITGIWIAFRRDKESKMWILKRAEMSSGMGDE